VKVLVVILSLFILARSKTTVVPIDVKRLRTPGIELPETHE
jgi:hypothetical protein